MRKAIQAAVLSTAGLATATTAAPIYVDQFLTGSTPSNGEYSTSSVLPGQSPTITNANGAWTFTDSGGGASNDVSFRPASTGLSGNGASGGSIESFRTSGDATDTFIAGRPAASNADTTIVAGEVLYFSGLVSFAAGNRVGIGADFENRRAFGIGFDTDGQAGIWYAGTSNNEFNSFQSKFSNPSTNQPFAADTTYLIVGRMLPNNGATTANETIEFLAINPTSTTEPISPLATYDLNVWGNATTTDTLDYFSLMASKSAGGVAATMDELRIGTSYADVVVVPEPASLALAGIASLLMGRRRR
jgi:hypothetical protein